MLSKAMDAFQIQKAEHTENVKAQYTDRKVKDYFRASELGAGDRKLFYTFFAHQLNKRQKSAKNLRQLANGDGVHERYQSAWRDMGALISMEERLSSKTDPVLGKYTWEWTGHYDGLLDANILRGYRTGAITSSSIPVRDEDTGEVTYWQMEPQIDEAYAEEIGIFKPNYQELKLVVDIKTMNPWGFKAIKDRGDLSNITGYLDQISFYMYMLGTPYGVILIENKEDNDVCEVQVVWTNFKENNYGFSDKVFAPEERGIVRTTVDTARFEKIILRINDIWHQVESVKYAHILGHIETVAEYIPPRCSEDPKNFPCSWGHKKGEPQYCEFYQHCWNPRTQGLSVFSEEVPEDAIWEFDAEDDNSNITKVQIDSRKVAGFAQTPEAFLEWLGKNGIEDLTKFMVTPPEEIITLEDIAEENREEDIFDANGNLIMEAKQPSEVQEHTAEDGSKAVKCPKCTTETKYKRLASNGIKKCSVCNHSMKVLRDSVKVSGDSVTAIL